MDYRVVQMDSHTWRIQEFGQGCSVSCYLLEGAERALLIDTGFGTIPLKRIVRGLTRRPVTALLSHGHADHIGGAGQFGAPYLHPADAPLYAMHSQDALRALFLPEGERPFAVNRRIVLLREGERFGLGGRSLRVIPAPGHSVGSVCFLDEERRWLYTGDTCCEADVLLNLEFSASVEVYLDTVRRLGKEPFDLIWPAHHRIPVEREVLKEFEEAAERLCEDKSLGETVPFAGKTARRFCWKRVGIVYGGDQT